MWWVKYQQITVLLSGETIARLKEGTPFSEKRVPNHAVEILRIALFRLFPPKTPEDWKDMSRYQGSLRHHLLFLYDLAYYILRRWMGERASLDWYVRSHVEQAGQLILWIPMGLMKWLEKIAHERQGTVSEAAVYAIEYGLQAMKEQRQSGVDVKESVRQAWNVMWRGLWRR